MKQKVILSGLICIVTIGMIIGGFWHLNPSPTRTFQQFEPKTQKTTDPTPAEFLIDRIEHPVPETVIYPRTTVELRAWFSEATEENLPRIFVDKLPDDFAEQGDKDLFAQVISALILRENENILKERAILTLLRQKQQKEEPWTAKETEFFNQLVTKYDSKSRKVPSAQMADLITKVNCIPPMTAVVQAAEATDWGKVNLDSPYDQIGWLDRKTYDRIPFNSLTEATAAYAREMNGMPPLDYWRISRANLNSRGYTDVGYRVLRWLGDYKMEDPDYTDKLHLRAAELGYEIPDTIGFLPRNPITFDKGEIMINHHSYAVEEARTREQRLRGLMFRTNIPEQTGMVFWGDKPQKIAIWMKNTFVPLDIVFFDENNTIIHILENVPPLDETPRGPEESAMGFVEFPAGTVQKDALKIGDKIKF